MAKAFGWRILNFVIFLCIVAAQSQNDEEIAQDEKNITQDEKEITHDEKVRCIQKLVEWCNNMQYPKKEGSGVAFVSISYSDDVGYYRIFCSTDSNGTNCTRNRSKWFSCTPDHVLSYKGEELTETTTDVDNDICKTQEKALNELFVQDFSYDNKTASGIEKELDTFFKEITAMREYIRELYRRLNGDIFTGDGFLGGFDGLPFQEPDTSPIPDVNKDDTNQIEKE